MMKLPPSACTGATARRWGLLGGGGPAAAQTWEPAVSPSVPRAEVEEVDVKVPAQLTLHMARTYEVLGDGEWHDLEVVLQAAAVTVPPGIAKRAMEAAEKWERRRRRTEQRRPSRAGHDDPSLIRRGQRRVARLAINRNARIERRLSEDGVEQIRLKSKETSVEVA